MNDTVSIDGLEFYVHPISTSYKTIAGLYVFMRSTIGKCGANWEILYIGEAEDLDARVGVGLKQHHRYDCTVVRNKATHIATRAVSGPRQARLDLEKKLRLKYDPPCNRQ